MFALSSETKSSLYGTIDSLVNSFLGPNKTLKYIINEDGESHLISCPVTYLQSTSLNSHHEQIVLETVNAHHNNYGCSSTTLLAMFNFWLQEFGYLIENGIKVEAIVNVSRKALDHVLTRLPQFEISVSEKLRILNDNITNVSYTQSTNKLKEKKNLEENTNLPKFLMKSRHFCAISHESVASYSHKIHLSVESNEVLVSAINKICHPDFSQLLAKFWKRQIEEQRTLVFDPSLVSTCSFVGPGTNSEIIDGILLKTNSNDVFYSSCKERRVLFISGDVTENFVHLGFSDSMTIIHEDSSANKSHSDSWLTRCVSLMMQLQISVIFVEGKVDSRIQDFTDSNKILVISNVPKNIFKKLVNGSNAHSAVYLLDCNETNVCTNITIQPWKTNENSRKYIIVSIDGNSHCLSTAVLYHPCKSACSMRKHQFLNSVSRLALATRTMSALPGGGKTENWCSQQLCALIKDLANKDIIAAMANGFSRYAELVQSKLLDSCSEEILDEKQSKIHAWQSALSLSLMVLQTDFILLNGEVENVGLLTSYIGHL